MDRKVLSCNGYAKALMKKADEVLENMKAVAIRLYVNINNPIAKQLYYYKYGYKDSCIAFLMEK